MMKKLFFFGMMGAMALTFAACSSEDEVAVNPTYDGNAVKTQFALNVGQGSFATRMTAENVQANSIAQANRFLGMEKMNLFAFEAEPKAANAASLNLTNKYALGNLAVKEMTQDHSNKFYTLQIPVGTTDFVFYGEAPAGSNAANGVLTNNLAEATTTTLGAVEFGLTKRATDAFATDGAKIATALTNIAKATGWSNAADPTLQTMYTQFITTEGKIRAGYGAAVIRMVDEIKSIATNVKAMNATGTDANTIATAILTAIEANPVTSYEAFPGDDMPAGAAQLTCKVTDGVATFSYLEAANAFGNVITTETINPQKIAYPAELVYWDNSDLRHSSVSKDASNYPDGVTNWATDGNWDSDWTVGAVAATTRAIAMKRNINYGVAGLHTTVTWTGSTSLADNRKTQALWEAGTPDASKTDETFKIDANSFTLTGVLVGGQSPKANWEFLPAGTTPTFDWAVYDNAIIKDDNGKNTNESYTLLLDNYAAEAKTVLVALEFTNNLTHKVKKMVTPSDGGAAVETEVDEPADFYGKDGRIIAGGKFYLVGKLEIPSTTTEWEEPYENSRIQQALRIFAQDRMTDASFTFTANALKNAYETIPDLQSVSMLFGLSVDIKWLKGLQFTNIGL